MKCAPATKGEKDTADYVVKKKLANSVRMVVECGIDMQ